MMFGLIFQAGLLVATGSYASIPSASVGPLIGAGICFAVANTGLYIAFQRGPVWLAAPLVACFGVFSVGIAMAGGTAVSIQQWGAIVMILGGITMIATLADRSDPQDNGKFWTVVSALIAAAGFSSTFYFGQTVTEMTNGLVSAMVTRIIAIGVFLTGILTLRLLLINSQTITRRL